VNWKETSTDMSLINDALKKAKRAQEQAPPPTGAPEFRAAESDHGRGSGPSLLMPVLLVAVIAIGGILIWLGLSGRKPAAEVATPKQTVVASVPAPAVQPVSAAPQPAAVVPPPVAPKAVPAQVAVEAPSPSVASAPPTAVAETVKAQPTTVISTNAEPPKPTVPKLGGIFFNPSRPSAVLNNKTVYVGSRVGEFTVLSITAESVTVVGMGKTNVLSLSE
jgi:hypothetical protein